MTTVELTSRRGTTWLLGALGTALLVGCLVWLRRGQSYTWLVDFEVYRLGAEAVLGGHGLYLDAASFSHMYFTYPPIAAVLFAPATLGPLAVTGFVWIVIDALALVGAIWCTLDAVGVRGPRPRAGLTGATAALAVLLVPVDLELALGQLNLILMFLVLLDLLRGNGRRWQGVGIGVAAGIKLIPLIYVVYLACTGRLRAAATAFGAFAGTVLLGFVLVPGDAAAYWFGPGLSANRPGAPQTPFNESLRGVLARLLGSDEPVSLAWLATAAVVGVLGLATAVALHRRGFLLRGVLVCALTALLVSPVSWLPHWVWVVPVLILLASLAWRQRSVWWLALTVLTAVVFGLRVVFWFVPPEAFYPLSSPANLGMAAGAQLAAATYPVLAVALIVALAYPVLVPARRDEAAPAPV
ncbi:glycosyltransferase 87 family protein [Actinophytocola sp.]|uniref:glycosyltransferase 87 family protein n=1 Tax=Actinophytocola sp. TaxID=1872138 RepID=UPI002ED9E109